MQISGYGLLDNKDRPNIIFDLAAQHCTTDWMPSFHECTNLANMLIDGECQLNAGELANKQTTIIC